MDAYTGYIIRLADARTSELRREAAEYALSRASRDRTSLRARAVSWLRRPQRPVLGPVVPAVPSLTLQPAERRTTA